MTIEDTSHLNPDELLQCAESAARAAGSYALEQRHRRNEIFRISANDVKLKLDLECQAVAEKTIRAQFPSHPIFGEESEDTADPNAPLLWMIDPIDGTVNFSHGLPLWCCSVALLSHGRVIAGCVFAPALGECYSARRDGPALCNASAISVSKTSSLEQAIVATGIDRKTRALSESLKHFERLTERIQRPRIMGSAALEICQVAAGKLDGYFESGIYLWDAAAGSLIVERAGGRSETLSRGPGLQISLMATNGLIHDELKQLFPTRVEPAPGLEPGTC